MTDRSLPAEFDGYKLIRLLGRGAMGEVHLAQDTCLDRQVAIKLISAAASDPAERARFAVEARAIARLQHPNVVAVHRVGEVEGRPYLVSEYVPGESLAAIGVPLPEPTVLRIAGGLAGALAVAHKKGVVHRDIKPANVILSLEGEAKLLDFGIAKLLGPATEREAVPDGGTSGTATASTAQDETARVEVSRHAEFDAVDPGLTSPGVVLGTPLYMAPEVWRGAPATFESDIYSLGALLYYLCAGHAPHVADSIEELRVAVAERDPMPLAEAAPGTSHALASIVERCLRRSPAERFASGDALRSALAGLTLARPVDVRREGNPYRGLSAFEAEHRDLFFGRDSEIRMILKRLDADPFVVVVGDSGVGKSSLCRAGVLPRIGEWLDRERRWSAVTVVPGRHPAAALAAGLAQLLESDEQEVARIIAEDPVEVGRRLRAKLGATVGLVIFIDQFEEIVTLTEPEERTLVARVLHWLTVPSPGLRILATTRGDFLSRISNVEPLGDDLPRALYFLRPLTAERIRDTIVGPAHAQGIVFEPENLVEELVESTVHDAGGLPLLQFTLAEMWESREGTIISRSTLDAVGGVAGALGRHADGVIDQMTSAERGAARKALLDLITAEGTRTRRSGDELRIGDRSVASALGKLVQGRLIVVREESGDATYEIAHEALIEGWATLAGWLSEDAEVKLASERLGAAAGNWERLSRAQEALWGAKQLREIDRIDPPRLALRDVEFIAASRRAIRRVKAVRAGALALLPLVALGVYTGFWWSARADLAGRIGSEVAAAVASLERARSIASEAAGLREQALLLFDAPDLAEAERLWVEYLAAAGESSPAYSTASRRLETALLLDPTRTDTRDMLADALYERALEAEKLGARAELTELNQRLSLYDADGSRRARWNEPGSISIAVDPPGARVVLHRYALGDDGRYRLDPVNKTVEGAGSVRLSPGSYLAEMAAAGRATVRHPFTLRRGEHRAATISLPLAAAIPEGFVYVPPGRFLFGSAADDDQRRDFFHTAPLHERETRAFLIARNETTFAQWLEFLAALPADARAEHLPRVGKGGFQGALSMEELEGGAWEMRFQPSEKMFVVRSGEKLEYPGRNRRRSQDWMSFPVFGISMADAVSYVGWLDRSGKLPGARLCSELEWERAARGADDREFPHGVRLLEDDANFDDTYGKVPLAMGPDEVGSHPASRSPFLIDDMAGNVWEWTVSALERGGYAARGGSYYYGRNTSRTPERAVTEPSFRDASVGLRVCADLPVR